MKKLFISVLAILTVLAVWACDEDTMGQETPVGNEEATGSYLLRQSDGFQQLLTLTTGGTVFSQNSDQRTTASDPFGDQQGAWKSTGEREITIKTLNFTYDFDTGAFTGYGRSTFTGKFDKDFNEFIGQVFVEIFGPDQDPLNPDAEPITTFGPFTFEGRRITAD